MAPARTHTGDLHLTNADDDAVVAFLTVTATSRAIRAVVRHSLHSAASLSVTVSGGSYARIGGRLPVKRSTSTAVS